MSEWTRFVYASDIHGDKQDAASVAALMTFVKDFKPAVRILGGDLWDFRPLRRKANDDERRESMAADFVAGMIFLRKFKPTVFLRGNHDERLWDLSLTDNGVLSDYANTGITEITKEVELMKCAMLPYDRRKGVYRIGHLKAIHGFHTGVFAARQAALVYGSVLAGHSHAIDAHTTPSLEQRTAYICGCLCDLNMEYARANTASLRWEHGFAYGVVNQRTGFFHVWQARKFGGKWLLPTGFKEM